MCTGVTAESESEEEGVQITKKRARKVHLKNVMLHYFTCVIML